MLDSSHQHDAFDSLTKCFEVQPSMVTFQSRLCHKLEPHPQQLEIKTHKHTSCIILFEYIACNWAGSLARHKRRFSAVRIPVEVDGLDGAVLKTRLPQLFDSGCAKRAESAPGKVCMRSTV